MNVIEQLLHTHCPDGVEFKTLGEVCELKRGDSITAKNTIEGDIPVVAGGQKPAYSHNQANRLGQTIVVAGSGAYAGYVSFWDTPIFLSDAFSVIPLDSEILSIKFVYYFLTSIQHKIYATKQGAGIPHVYPNSAKNFKIPIPPLVVQEEIVSILNNFERLTNDLQSGLPAEIEARKKQYEYYRDKLLSFKERG